MFPWALTYSAKKTIKGKPISSKLLTCLNHNEKSTKRLLLICGLIIVVPLFILYYTLYKRGQHDES